MLNGAWQSHTPYECLCMMRQPETKLGIAQTNTPHKTRALTLGSLKRYPALLRLAGKPCVGKR
ncbi:hypothetical protein [Kingella oralis]|uniref:hypothetical protein n=1 Tax=Kingella oralis TaxID=505 RepID=UPI0034E60EA9